MKTTWFWIKKVTPVCLFFLIIGGFMLALPERVLVNFHEGWESIGWFFIALKYLFLLFLVFKWNYCCKRFCEWKERPDLAVDLSQKWPLFFSVIFVIELVGVWR